MFGLHQSHPQPLSCNHLVKCSGIETAISGLYGGLGGHYQLEQGTHTWLDIVLNVKTLIKRPEEWEAIREGMGKLWRTCLGRNPVTREGGWSAGHEESSGPRIEERRGAEEGTKISN